MPRKNRTPKHQPYIDTNTCSTKRKFRNEEEASKSAELRSLQNNENYTAYKCDRCSGWHLTTNKKDSSQN